MYSFISLESICLSRTKEQMLQLIQIFYTEKSFDVMIPKVFFKIAFIQLAAPKPNDSSFIVINDKEQQQLFNMRKLKPANVNTALI